LTLNKILLVVFAFAISTSASAEPKMKMYFKDADLLRVIEIYSKASGQKFIVDPGVHGKISIFVQEPLTMSEAFNQLSTALAINSVGISKQGDTMVIKPARNIQRDLIEVSTERPSLKPERMYTWIYSVKNTSAQSIMQDLRMLASKDGEIMSREDSNQIIFTDWTSNLNKIAEVLKQVDKPVDSATAKIIEGVKREREMVKKDIAKQKGE
jgi:type II secretory pathway component GspD/PulD (secretin)